MAGKFVFSLILVFLTELALYLFAGQTSSNTAIFTMILDPSSIVNTTFYLVIAGALTVFAFSKIIPGTFLNVNMYGVYAGIVAVTLTYIMNLVHLSAFIQAQLIPINPTLALVVNALVCGPLFFLYLIATMEWVRFN